MLGTFPATNAPTNTMTRHLASQDWTVIGASLDARGHVLMRGLLDADDCARMIGLFDVGARFRKHVVMQQHGYGQGEYKYFDHPLPPQVAGLRQAFYPPLAEIANRWNERLRVAGRFPATHEAFLARCHTAGQMLPTPLLLRYGPGDYNRLHQDLYGEHVFPLQITVLLSAPGRDFEGGEFVLTEQAAHMQARAEVVPLGQGDAVIFAVRQRPEPGPRGYRRVTVRHGVATLRAGRRHTLGIIFHDAA